MSDCPNAEMRDRLPDLLHERLDERARAAGMAPVEDCADCHVELALLREARIALSPSGVLSIDLASITRVVVERTRTPVSALPRRRSRWGDWGDWRIAASVVLAAGAGAMMIARHPASSKVPGASAVSPRASAPNVGASTSVASAVDRERIGPSAVVTERRAELSAAGGVSELSETDLQSLLESLNDIDAVPPTDPEPVTVRVTLPGTGSSE